ncbi:uncharacterized protein LOC141850516 [Brevipalpus obovatus]|uniref:uncharacterized protein LOC141850516 n=1 Tax=Brevipalpus obovatus TaxID=246614 RepID=UPI003D9E5BE5
MGLDLDLFVDTVEDELKCPICYRVLINPMTGRNCDHLFCYECISTWIKCTPECPMDRTPLIVCDLQPAPKIIQNLLARLELRCSNHAEGCCWIMQLKDLDDHLTWCLFNSTNPKHDLLPNSPSKLNPIKQIRLIADQSKELQSIRDTIEELKQFYEEEQKRSIETQEMVDNFSKYYRDLNRHLHDTTNPLCELLLSNELTEESEECSKKTPDTDTNSSSSSNRINNNHVNEEDEHKIESVSIRNMNEFITTSILIEYLRQNDIYVLSCETECCHWQRSRDFRIEVRTFDLTRLLSPDLWPRGVSVCALGPKSQVIFGSRDKEAASIAIQPGIIC